MKRASDYTRELAAGIADLNTRRTKRAEAGVHFLLGFLGALGALMLAVHLMVG